MHSSYTTLAWTLPLAVLTALSPARPPGDPSDPLEALAARLEAAHDLVAVQANLRGLEALERANLERDLIQAEEALEAEDGLLGLRSIERITYLLSRAVPRAQESEPADLENLRGERDAILAMLDALEPPLARAAERPAALQAQCERAYTTARGYLASSTEQGREASLFAGTHYLERGRVRAELYRLLASLEVQAPARPLGELPGLDSHLGALEAELLELYRPPLDLNRHGTFIELSSRLKVARELRDAGHRLGALEESLAVARRLALFDVAPTDLPGRASLRAQLARWEQQLVASADDASLPRVWLAEARATLDDPEAELGSVFGLVERVLPGYVACLEEQGNMASLEAPSAEAELTVTLVRWPFT